MAVDHDPRPPVLWCPSCGVVLGTAIPDRCPTCTAPVGGDTGRRLIGIDQHIATLGARRTDLLDRLRHEVVTTARVPEGRQPAATGVRHVTASEPPDGRSPGPVRRWLAAAGPQTLLAAGGVLLLAVAAVVFTAVAWRDLSMLARAGVLLTAAAGSGRLTATLVRRELRRTAEATGVLTIALLAVLCNGLWMAGLLDLPGRGPAVLAVSATALALVAHGLARLTGTRSPLILAAWLVGTAVHAAGVWLTGFSAAAGGTALDVVVLLAVDLIAVVVAGGYAARRLTGVPRWRVATFVGAGVLWLGSAVGAPVVLVALAPSTPSDVVPYGVGVAVVIATVVIAATARHIAGPLAARWPEVGTAAMWLAGTLGVAGAVSNRLEAWPDLAVVAALTAGAATLVRCPTTSQRASAVAGMTPVLLAAAVPVGSTAAWALGVLDGTGLQAPDVMGLASVVMITGVVGALAVVVERARVVLTGASATSWLAAVVAAGIGAAVLAPSDAAQLPAFVAHAALLAALAALAGHPVLVPRPAAAGALSFAVTIGATGLLWGRVAAWPQLPIILALALGAALVRRHARTVDQLGALAGLAPVAVAATAMVVTVAVWIDAVLAHRVRHPWAADVPTVAVPQPDAATLAAAVAACMIAVGLAVAVHRTGSAAVILATVGNSLLLAVGAAVWPVAGAAVGGLVVVAGAVAGLRAAPGHPVPLVLVAAATVVTAGAALTTPWVTIVTLGAAAVATAAALPIGIPHVAAAIGWLLTADLIALAAACAAAVDRDPAVTGMTVVGAAAGGWLVAAAVRRDRHHALGTETAAAVAFVLGVPLAATGGARWLGVAFAVLAVASAVVAVWRADRRWLQWVAAVSSSAASWSIFADAGVETVEVYTAPPALLLVGLAAARLRARPDVSSWPLLGSGLGLLTVPTVVQLTDDPGDLPRLAVAVTLGAALVVAGRVWALQSPLVVGVTVCGVAALTQHAVVTQALPRWVLLAAAGVLLLWLSISYEAQRRRLTVARRRLVAMR